MRGSGGGGGFGGSTYINTIRRAIAFFVSLAISRFEQQKNKIGK